MATTLIAGLADPELTINGQTIDFSAGTLTAGTGPTIAAYIQSRVRLNASLGPAWSVTYANNRFVLTAPPDVAMGAVAGSLAALLEWRTGTGGDSPIVSDGPATADVGANDRYVDGKIASIASQGEIWVEIFEGVTVGNGVTVNTSDGRFGNGTGSATATVVPGARWMDSHTYDANGNRLNNIGIVRLDGSIT